MSDTQPHMDSLDDDPNLTAELFPPSRTESIRNNLRLLTASGVILACLATGYTLYALSSILVPLVLAFVLTYLVSPVVTFFSKKLHMGHIFGVVLAMLVAAGFVFLVGYMIAYSVSEAIDGWPAYQLRFTDLVDAILKWLKVHGWIDAKLLKQGYLALLPVSSGEIAISAVGRLVTWMSSLFMVIVFVFFMLIGQPLRQGRSSELLDEIDDRVKKYLLVKTAMAVITGLLVGLTLSLIGVDLAILFGVIAFLLSFIPTFGGIIATVLPFMLAMVQFDGWVAPLLVLAIPGSIQLIIGTFIEPQILGDRLHVHPVVILFSLVLWGLIWGLPGMLMAAPLTAIIKIIFSHIETTKPVARIIEGHFP
jgi:AI-2 transport protein TqsA